jgi:hypothetical protein
VTLRPGSRPLVTQSLNDFLNDLYRGQERLTRDEIQRRAVTDDLPTDVKTRIDALPEGEYALDEVAEALTLEDPA